MATKTNKTAGKTATTKTAQLKFARELEVGVPTKGTGLLTDQGGFEFTPANKIAPEDFKGMKVLKQEITSIGTWSICRSTGKDAKYRVSVTVPDSKKDVLVASVRTSFINALGWIIENMK